MFHTFFQVAAAASMIASGGDVPPSDPGSELCARYSGVAMDVRPTRDGFFVKVSYLFRM